MDTKTVFLRFEDDVLVGVFAKRHRAESRTSWHFLDGTPQPIIRIEEQQVIQ